MFVAWSEGAATFPTERMARVVASVVSVSVAPSRLKLRINNLRISSVGSTASESVSAESVDASLHASSALLVCFSAFDTNIETINAVETNTANSIMFSR